MSAIISLRHLTKSYGDSKAVDHLDLTVERGEFFGFLGPNGAGKTTTIRMITGMIPADSGEIRVEDASRIGVMPESRGLYGWMTAGEYLTFFSDLYGMEDVQEKAVDALLKQVGLLENKHQAINTFSRGMKQRLALARSIINKPSLLILDEPTLGLDPQGQQDIQTLLLSLHKQGVTIFFSSHLLPEVSRLCTRIGIIHKGKLVKMGTMEELQKGSGHSDLTEIFLSATRS